MLAEIARGAAGVIGAASVGDVELDEKQIADRINQGWAGKKSLVAQNLGSALNIILKNMRLCARKYFHKVLACSGVVYYYITKSPKHPVMN
jgi:hypothetical protein